MSSSAIRDLYLVSGLEEPLHIHFVLAGFDRGIGDPSSVWRDAAAGRGDIAVDDGHGSPIAIDRQCPDREPAGFPRPGTVDKRSSVSSPIRWDKRRHRRS